MAVTEYDSNRLRLERECHVFCRYLVGRAPSDYVLKKFLACHARMDIAPADYFDSLLLVAARCSRGTAYCADSYASRFCKRSVVRTKLVVLLAILECSPHFHRIIDTVDHGRFISIYVRLFGRGMAYGLALLAGIAMFGVPHLATQLLVSARRCARNSLRIWQSVNARQNSVPTSTD